MGGYDGLALAMYDTNDQSFVNKGADNFFSITITDATTMTSGYIQPFYTSITSTGSKTGAQGGAQVVGFAADIALGGTQSSWTSGAFIYVSETGTATMTDHTLDGYTVFFCGIGSACVYRAGFHAFSEEADAYVASGVDAGLLVESAGASGTWKSVIGVMGITQPNYFLYTQGASTVGRMISAIAGEANVGAAALWLRCYVNGTQYWIALCASCAD